MQTSRTGRADRARPHVGGGLEEVQQEQEPHQEVRQEVRRLPRLGLAHQAGKPSSRAVRSAVAFVRCAMISCNGPRLFRGKPQAPVEKVITAVPSFGDVFRPPLVLVVPRFRPRKNLFRRVSCC